ncbi:GNAT family N-acetyltransferase [Rhizobium sp. KVB221]|uniref:GNAT family N-acetyltransferase n=1 Tax=Rhizobium setariae TaxID=2801340 RepID=A0A936YMC2_9HYPH|nr:GNAT family protein [Rhizobium setariae]MBL0370841.1 GNAT family N-acetyltransferase [Rhizobium setariae]
MARSVFGFLSKQATVEEISGPDHFFRLPRNSDYPQWYKLRSESRNFLEKWEPAWESDALTEGSFRSRVIRCNQEFASGVAQPLFLYSRQQETLLGGLTIGHIRRGASQSCMVGYWMGERHAGKGHMTAAIELAVHHIFDRLNLHRIEAACIPENERSIRLLEKAGFRREGYMHDYLKIRGEWRDHLLYALVSNKHSKYGASSI